MIGKKPSDGTNWTTLLPIITTELGDGPTAFALGDVSARYVRLNTHYNSEGSIYHSYAEVRFYAGAVMEAENQAAWNAINAPKTHSPILLSSNDSLYMIPRKKAFFKSFFFTFSAIRAMIKTIPIKEERKDTK